MGKVVKVDRDVLAAAKAGGRGRGDVDGATSGSDPAGGGMAAGEASASSEGGDARAAGYAAGLAAAEANGGGGRQAEKEGGNRQSRRRRSKRAGKQALVGGAKGFNEADVLNAVAIGGGRKGLNLNTQQKRPRTRLDFVEAEVKAGFWGGGVGYAKLLNVTTPIHSAGAGNSEN